MTKLNKPNILLFLGAVLGIFLITSCSNEDHKPLSLHDKIGEYLSMNQQSNEPGLSIAIRHSGQVLYENSIGLARLSDNRRINANTQFRVGSITKPITGIAIMQLVEDQQLDLDDLVATHLPYLPSSYARITIEQLLSHRAGLLDYIDDNTNLSSLNNMTMADVPAMLDGSGLENLQFAPGAAGDYSNTGYVLLALVLEEVTGMTYPEYLKTNIFEPLGMHNSFVISDKEHLGDHGENYALSFGNKIKVKGFNSLIYGGSGVVSTTSDLMLFAEAVLNNELVSEETLDLMTKSRGPLPELADYGLGWLTGIGQYWHTHKYTDPNDFWHTGGFDGYRTVLYFNPDLDLQLIILTNNGEASQQEMFDILEMTRNHFK